MFKSPSRRCQYSIYLLLPDLARASRASPMVRSLRSTSTMPRRCAAVRYWHYIGRLLSVVGIIRNQHPLQSRDQLLEELEALGTRHHIEIP